MVLRPLDAGLQKVANEQLNEDPQRIENDLQTLKRWIAKQPHLKSRTDDQFLIAFLRNCKYNMDEAKLKLDNYYAYIEKNADLLKRSHMKEEKFHKLLKSGVVILLPQAISNVGPRVLLVRNGAYDPKEFTFAEISQFRQLLQDILFMDDDIAVVSGLIYVIDFKDATASHYLQANPAAIKKLSQYMEEAVPLDLKANHFLNTASAFTTLFNLMKPFMPARSQSKMYVHGDNLEEFYTAVPQEILPLEYGGQSASVQDLIDQSEQKVLSYIEYFNDNDLYGVDESLRVTPSYISKGSKFLGIF